VSPLLSNRHLCEDSQSVNNILARQTRWREENATEYRALQPLSVVCPLIPFLALQIGFIVQDKLSRRETLVAEPLFKEADDFLQERPP
jgi:hypothetical protein